MEQWKQLKDINEIYFISNYGRLKSTYKGAERILIGGYDKNGYLLYGLMRNKKLKSYKAHRLVAKNFIENPFLKPQVNHINGIKSDNRVENLEWVNQSENTLHSYYTLNRKKSRAFTGRFGDKHPNSDSVVRVSLDGFIIEIYGSKAEASRNTDININTLIRYIKNNKKLKNSYWL